MSLLLWLLEKSLAQAQVKNINVNLYRKNANYIVKRGVTLGFWELC